MTTYYSLHDGTNVAKREGTPKSPRFFYASDSGWKADPTLIRLMMGETDNEECSESEAKNILSKKFPDVKDFFS